MSMRSEPGCHLGPVDRRTPGEATGVRPRRDRRRFYVVPVPGVGANASSDAAALCAVTTLSGLFAFTPRFPRQRLAEGQDDSPLENSLARSLPKKAINNP